MMRFFSFAFVYAIRPFIVFAFDVDVRLCLGWGETLACAFVHDKCDKDSRSDASER